MFFSREKSNWILKLWFLPVPKRGRERRDSFTGPENHENKRKIGQSKEILLFRAVNLQASRASKLFYSVYTTVNLRVGRGPVNIGFTGPVRALDAPDFSLLREVKLKLKFRQKLISPLKFMRVLIIFAWLKRKVRSLWRHKEKIKSLTTNWLNPVSWLQFQSQTFLQFLWHIFNLPNSEISLLYRKKIIVIPAKKKCPNMSTVLMMSFLVGVWNNFCRSWET